MPHKGKEAQGKGSYGDNQRSVGLQTVANDRTYVSPRIVSLHNLEANEFLPIFYKPHTLVSLAIFLVGLFYFANTESPQSDVQNEYRKAFFGMVCAFLAFGCIYMPNTLMVRPHPLFWRFCLCLQVLYAMTLTYFFILPVNTAR